MLKKDRFEALLSRLLKRIEHLSAGTNRPVMIAIDGRSGSGKSTIALELTRRLTATIVSGDDFFAGSNALYCVFRPIMTAHSE